MRTGCCTPARTLYRCDASGNVLATADYYYTRPRAPIFEGSPVSQCDADPCGNFYQGGFPTDAVISSSGSPQVNPMYVLRSWDASLKLRWSWSEAPFGTVSGGTRTGPTPLLGVRAIPDASACNAYGYGYGSVPALIIGDNWTLNADGKTNARALDAQGNQVWAVKLTGGYQLVACGATRSLWQAPSLADGGAGSCPWKILRNSDGATMFTKPHAVYGGFASGGPVTNYVTMDADDKVYEAQSHQEATPRTHVTLVRYSNDGATVDWTTQSIYCRTTVAAAGSGMGDVDSIVISGSAVYVGTYWGSVPGYIERFSKGAGAHIGTAKLGGSRAQLFFAGSAGLGYLDAGGSGGAASLRQADGERNLAWRSGKPPTAGVAQLFKDARQLPDGGTLWGQNRTSLNHGLAADTGTAVPLCGSPNCAYVAVTSGIGPVWDTPTNTCTTGCTCLLKAPIGFAVNDGAIPAPVSVGDTMSLDCY